MEGKHLIPISRSLNAGVLFLVLLVLAVGPAFGSEITLLNGDRITGEVISMEKELLLVRAPYADKLTLRWDMVRCLASDKELTFVLKSGAVLIGIAVCRGEDTMRVTTRGVGGFSELGTRDIASINPAPPPPAVTYKALVTLGGTMTEGNSDTQALNSGLRFEARSTRHRFTFGGRYHYGETEDEVATRNAMGSLKYDFFLTEKLYSYAQSFFEEDEFQDLNLRSTLGMGLGYQFLDTKRVRLHLEAGLSYFNEDFDTAPDQKYSSSRWAAGLDMEVLQDRVKFFHLHEGYLSVEDAHEYYIRSEQGFRVALVGSFFANFQVNYSYNSSPAPGKVKSDTGYIVGLAYDHGF